MNIFRAEDKGFSLTWQEDMNSVPTIQEDIVRFVRTCKAVYYKNNMFLENFETPFYTLLGEMNTISHFTKHTHPESFCHSIVYSGLCSALLDSSRPISRGQL